MDLTKLWVKELLSDKTVELLRDEWIIIQSILDELYINVSGFDRVGKIRPSLANIMTRIEADCRSRDHQSSQKKIGIKMTGFDWQVLILLVSVPIGLEGMEILGKIMEQVQFPSPDQGTSLAE